ncbi:MAG: universal stress protein [Clostridiales bacterium]|nr:universal stress protein [Clostridiales bacterium]MCF8023421.1 universal stress protein [Clostridiales bacterium]
MFAKALFPIDLNQTMEETITRAKFISQLGTKYIHFLHIMPPGLGNLGHAQRRLDDIAVMLHSYGFGITRKARVGSPADTICQEAKDNDASYIYIPGRCKNVMYYALLGSTTRDVIRLTEKPAFVHKKRPDPWKQKGLSRVIYATDFEETAERSLTYLKSLSSTVSDITILHAGQRGSDPVSEKRRQLNVNNNLEHLEKELAKDFAEVKVRAGVGLPDKLILEEAELSCVDLVVLGSLNQGLKQKIIGSTAEEVTGKSKCSILLVP